MTYFVSVRFFRAPPVGWPWDDNQSGKLSPLLEHIRQYPQYFNTYIDASLVFIHAVLFIDNIIMYYKREICRVKMSEAEASIARQTQSDRHHKDDKKAIPFAWRRRLFSRYSFPFSGCLFLMFRIYAASMYCDRRTADKQALPFASLMASLNLSISLSQKVRLLSLAVRVRFAIWVRRFEFAKQWKLLTIVINYRSCLNGSLVLRFICIRHRVLSFAL